GIESRADGAATITASDTAGAEGSYLVTVTGNTPDPFYIDITPMRLHVGDFASRNASGGSLPYIYSSDAPAIVRVLNMAKSDIQAMAAGKAKIFASDGTGTRVYYLVSSVSP
ncbi:hypothetical protein SAMN02800694_3377, partial [Luteibacter sp. UNCMF331Sha3.1]|uniref:hypothetical protein n=1 Tax=Luteibacter sp. UNCMF331Sha3.1 TaxID=1502760 RepID=UPI0008BBC344